MNINEEKIMTVCGKTVNEGEITNIDGKRHCKECATERFSKKVKAKAETEEKIEREVIIPKRKNYPVYNNA